MTEIDTNIILELINKYGVEELKKIIEMYEYLLTYIYETKTKYEINSKSRFFLYNENNNQVFTNERTSIFYLNNKIFNLNKLKLNDNITSSQIVSVETDGIQKYFDKSKKIFGNSFSQTTLKNSNGSIFYNSKGVMGTISLTEYKLIKLLLKNPKVYTSCKNSAIYAEGENGFAYVLGNKDGKQFRF